MAQFVDLMLINFNAVLDVLLYLLFGGIGLMFWFWL